MILLVPRASAVESLGSFEFFKGEPVGSLSAPIISKVIKSKKMDYEFPVPSAKMVMEDGPGCVHVSVFLPDPFFANVIYSPFAERAPPNFRHL